MSETIEGGSDFADKGISKVINRDVIENVLGSAGLGSWSDKEKNKNPNMDIEHGAGYEDLAKDGKVITKDRAMKEQEK